MNDIARTGHGPFNLEAVAELRILDDWQDEPGFRLHMEKARERARADAKARKRPRVRSGQYANNDPQIAFLRQRISRLNYGEKVEGVGKALPKLTNKQLVVRYNRGELGGKYGAALKNDEFKAHFEGGETYYFWADHRTATPEILVKVDIDAGDGHGGVGTSEGARKFAEVVKERVLPGMYHEPSNGGGVHGYIVVKKAGTKVTKVREALRNLDRYLKRLAEATGADIACVEIKGMPPDSCYDKKGDITSFKGGTWAKLPRGAGVVDTCRIDHSSLAVLDCADIVDEAPGPEAGSSESSTSGRPAKTATRIGSYDSRIVTQQILDELPALQRYAEKLLVQWTGKPELKAGRWAVTAVDLAQFFAVMLAIKPDRDDSLPVRRIGRLWEEVYQAGDFARPWNHHRFKAIRDLLSRHGHINWIDFRYQNGEEGQGRACRWRLSYLLDSALRSLVMGEATSVDTDSPLPDGKHEFKTPKWYNFALERERRWEEHAERSLTLLFAA